MLLSSKKWCKLLINKVLTKLYELFTEYNNTDKLYNIYIL